MKNLIPITVTHPELAEQFDDILNDVKSSTISYGDNRSYWFTCSVGHSWKAKLYNRTLHKNYQCAVCIGKIILVGFNDLLTSAPIKIIEEIDFPKNYSHGIIVLGMSPFEKNKIWWKCNKNHSWDESPKNRMRSTGCPYCSGKRLAYEDSIGNHILCKEYSKNNILKPDNISMRSRKIVFWTCEKIFQKHEWEASPYNRIFKDQKCPYCLNKKSLAGINEIKATHPELYVELLDKNVIVRFNESRSVQWKCQKCLKIWNTSPRNRIIRGDKCSCQSKKN